MARNNADLDDDGDGVRMQSMRSLDPTEFQTAMVLATTAPTTTTMVY
jgi:hypothetical protein